MKLIQHLRLLVPGLLICLGVSGQQEGNGYNNLPAYIVNQSTGNEFSIVSHGHAAVIRVDPGDWKGVIRAATDLTSDVHKVTGVWPKLEKEHDISEKSILIGTIGKSRLIDRLIAEKKIDVSSIKGQWESFVIQTVGSNLIVAGSDKRGTIYGIYDISEKIGVSPWYWWADVPVKKHQDLFVKDGRYLQGSPKIKYRGVFINDESPSFSGWAKNKFGGINSKLYVHLFELLLRLKANYLWPAMWDNAFNEDDPQSPILADEYGIVMGTSHHEPMMRAHKEYTRRRNEVGPWDYAVNKTNLDKFFTEGLARNKHFDNLITIGMRGDGDLPMGNGNDLENMKVLHKVIEGERKIIRNVYGKDPATVPQLWAIFTEIQRYYDDGFTVPDDVTLLFCDNNWGYIRRTGPEKEKNRKGGMGLYYHIDMNGGPWNDRWVNTTTIPKLREQLNLAYQTGLDKIWIINVGDLKPKELPIDFILRYAWNPNKLGPEDTWDYTVQWAKHIFGDAHAQEIADLVSKYAKYNLMRKPEVQVPGIFSYVNYHEADSMMKLWNNIADRATALSKRMPAAVKDAFYQLVLYPVKASAGIAGIYYYAGLNHLYAKQGRVHLSNEAALKARVLFSLDKKLSDFYNDSISQGKWKNMMLDVHMGYTKWSMPKENKLPPLIKGVALSQPTLGVAVEGSEAVWPGADQAAQLPVFDVLNEQSYYIDIFNKGVGAFDFKVKANRPWIKLSQTSGKVDNDIRLFVNIEWEKLPVGTSTGELQIFKTGEDHPVKIAITAKKVILPQTKEPYFGGAGEFSIPAVKFNGNVKGKHARWILLNNLGRADGCMGVYPVTAPSAIPADAPRLEYKIFTFDTSVAACLGILPTQDVDPARGLRIAVSIDGLAPKILDARQGFVDIFNEYTPEALAISKSLKPLPPVNQHLALRGNMKPRRNEIFDNIRWLDFQFNVKKPGMHTIKVFMIDPEVVLERIVVNPDNTHPSYFGAPAVQH